MNYAELMQKAVEAAKLVSDIKKTAEAIASTLSETQLANLKDKLDEIHPVTMQMGQDLDKALEKAKKTA